MREVKIISILLMFLVIGCKQNPRKVDVSSIDLDVKIARLDQDLFALRGENSFNLKKVKEQYREFFPLYCNKVIELGNPDNARFPGYLQKFLNDSVILQTYARCQEVFPDLIHQKEAITQAFKHYRYYYPQGKIPHLYAHISGFNQSMVVAPNIISMSLDRYLGADCEFYAQLGLPQYMRYKMTPERLAQDVILAFGLTEFSFNPKHDNLLSNIIYQGKIRYFLQAMMPDLSVTDIMGYKPQEMEWCKANEENIWGYLIEQKYLFSTQYRMIMKYINDGPFTPGMPKESPSRCAVWIGLNIVKAYMQAKPQVDLPTLMKESDYEKILRESEYDSRG